MAIVITSWGSPGVSVSVSAELSVKGPFLVLGGFGIGFCLSGILMVARDWRVRVEYLPQLLLRVWLSRGIRVLCGLFRISEGRS